LSFGISPLSPTRKIFPASELISWAESGSRASPVFRSTVDSKLFSTEHGRSGLLSGLDELNIIHKGENYGWPDSQGNTKEEGTFGPIVHSGSDRTWAPASLAYSDGKLYWGGLRGETLYATNLRLWAQNHAMQVGFDYSKAERVKEYFSGQFGRIRAVVAGPDGMLYISTSNRDGRGDVRVGDDKIIRINPSLLQ